MKVIPMLDPRTGMMDLHIVLEDGNIERIHQYDPAQVRVQEYGPPFDTAPVRFINVCYANAEEQARIVAIAQAGGSASGGTKEILAMLFRGVPLSQAPRKPGAPKPVDLGGNYETVSLDTEVGVTNAGFQMALLVATQMLHPIVSKMKPEWRGPLLERFMSGLAGVLVQEAGAERAKQAMDAVKLAIDDFELELERVRSTLN